MDRIAIKTSNEPKIIIENATSDLRIKGWELDEIRADADGKKSVSYQEEGETHRIKCMRDCFLRVPSDSQLTIKNISGETFIKSIYGTIQIGTAAGGVVLKETGAIEIEQVGGEFSAKQIEGDVKVNKIGGSAQVRDIDGKISIGSVSGNFVLRGEAMGLEVKADGEANLKFDPGEGESFQVAAGGSIFCRIPEESHTTVSLKSKGQSIRVKTDELSEHIQEQAYELTLGDGSSKIELAADGSLQFSTFAFSDPESFEFDFDFGQDITGLADEITQQVSEQLEGQMEALNEQLNHLALGLETKHMARARAEAEKAERRVAAAQHRLERRMARAQRKAVQRSKKIPRHYRGGDYAEFLSRAGGKEAIEPVGDDERRMVLEMVQNNKINVEDAEKLLAAMEGRVSEDMQESESPTPEDGPEEETPTNES